MEKKLTSSFYCRPCSKDFEAEGVRGYMNSVHKDVLLTACPSCERVCWRSLSNRRFDPFFAFSRAVNVMRNKYKRDIMQRNDPMFDIYYPQQKREELERENQLERELWQKRKSAY